MKQKKLLSSKLTILALLAVAGFLANTKYQQYKQNAQVEAEKQKILSQINVLQKKNQEVAGSIEYFQSEGFKQRVAREQLNLKKPDEQLFSFRESGETAQKITNENQPQPTNPQKWLKYFAGIW